MTSDRAPKRRKISKLHNHVDHNCKSPFPPLLAGKEDVEFTQLRYESFELAWNPKEGLLDVMCVQAFISRFRNL